MKCHIVNKSSTNVYKKYYPLIRSYFKKTFKVLKIEGNYDISLILVDPLEIRKINRDFRHIDKETDVISFAEIDGEDFDSFLDETIYLGDIFINVERIEKQALDYGHSEEREFVFLFVHGLLHCLGYDHIKKEDEEVMIAKQKLILGDLNWRNLKSPLKVFIVPLSIAQFLYRSF